MVKRYNSGRKRTISDVKQYKRDWFKRHKRVFLEDKIFHSWLQILAQEDLLPKLLWSENANFKFSVNNEGEDVN